MVNSLTKDRLQEYIEKREFIIYLQPQYSVSQNTVVGAEALARWIHEGTFISPGEFIPALEQNGLVTILDAYIWECVFAFQAKRQQEGLNLVPISINVSREDFTKIDVCQTMIDLSRQYNVAADYVHIEITESAFVTDSARIYESISKLRAYGFKILLDDFGSGYSALNVLKDIEADVIKLDMKFFDLTEENRAKGQSIIESVVQMAQLLKLGLIAEGVENTEQLDILKAEGCDIIQGYFFYRPMSQEDFNQLLNDINNIQAKEVDLSALGQEYYDECLKLTREGKYDDALTLAKRAMPQINPETDPGLYCQFENLTGIIYGGIGNEMMALDHYLAGLSLALQSNVTAVSAKIYNNIGAEYQKLGAFDQSIKYFELSLKEQEKNANDKSLIMLAYKTDLNLCMSYMEREDYKKAEECLNRAYTYIDNPDVAKLVFHYQTIQSTLFLKTGREKEVRKSFPQLVELILGAEDSFNIWDNFERLGQLALDLKEYDVLKRIIDSMDREFKELPEEMIDLDVLVTIQEFRLEYYKEIGDLESLLQQGKTYVDLCKRMCQQAWKDRATNIDYKIQVNTEHEENVKQRKQIDIDHLTGVGNSYKLEKDYKLLQKYADEKGIAIAIGIIDLDFFKEVNDTSGHLQGDHHLMAISQIIEKVTKGSGQVYRCGGDEFLVLLVGVDASEVKGIAQKIKKSIAGLKLLNQISATGFQTVSQGYIVLDSVKNFDIWQLFSSADNQLDLVKQGGRDGYKIMEPAYH